MGKYTWMTQTMTDTSSLLKQWRKRPKTRYLRSRTQPTYSSKNSNKGIFKERSKKAQSPFRAKDSKERRYQTHSSHPLSCYLKWMRVKRKRGSQGVQSHSTDCCSLKQRGLIQIARLNGECQLLNEAQDYWAPGLIILINWLMDQPPLIRWAPRLLANQWLEVSI